MFVSTLHELIPHNLKRQWRRLRRSRKQRRVARLAKIDEDQFRCILTQQLGVRQGDVVFVHSSLDRLPLGFPFFRVLGLLREAVGDGGTLLFPTDPPKTSIDFLRDGDIFSVRQSRSGMGIISELACRQGGAIRSVHPIKSVCALGRHGQSLTNSHHLSPYPYSDQSPYAKIMLYQGKVIGLGVTTQNLSFVHCVDDALRDVFPVHPYHDELFEAECIDDRDRSLIVKTYAHNLDKMRFDNPRFMRQNIPAPVCQDITIAGAPFFRADASGLFERMVELARKGTTIYPKYLHQRKPGVQ